MQATHKRDTGAVFKRLSAAAVSLFLIVCCLACEKSTAEKNANYGVFLGVNPEQIHLLKGYDTVVIDAAYFTKEEVETIRQNGAKTICSYLNIGSIEDFREGYDSLKDCILAPYDNWPGEYWVNVSRPEWQRYITQSASALIGKGVDGFFLDNTDVYYLYPTSEVYDGLVSILSMLNTYHKDILINGGDVFVSKAILEADEPQIEITGVNQECVFTNIDFTNNALVLQDAQTSQYYQDYLAACKEKGLAVYLLEYAIDVDAVEETIQAYCNRNGFQYYRSTSIDLVG
ncbi:MAG: endo alpha-1,4 polygalactosaminidase [Clostridiaceae bacterium]